MKISKLIEKLYDIEVKYGDLDVCMDHEIDDAPTIIEVIGVVRNLEGKKGDRPDYITIRPVDESYPIFPISSESRWVL